MQAKKAAVKLVLKVMTDQVCTFAAVNLYYWLWGVCYKLWYVVKIKITKVNNLLTGYWPGY